MSQGATFFTSAYSENMPPSPLLSARMAMSTYLTVVSSVIVQMMSESAPRIKSSFTCAMPPLPLRIDFITYSGDVPMSPVHNADRHKEHTEADSFLFLHGYPDSLLWG